MIFCARCGARNPAEARFCYRCGQPILPSPEAPVLSQRFSPPAPVYSQPAPYNYASPPPGYNYVAAGPEVLRYHPLAEGIKWLPADLESQPREFYSYVNQDNRLAFVRRAGFWKRFLAAGLDLMLLTLPILALSVFDTTLQNRATGATAPDPNTANPLAFVYLVVILGYFFLTGIISGQSFGKKAQRLRVIRLDGRKPDWMTAAIRYLAGYLVSANLLVLSLLVLVVGSLNNSTVFSGLVGMLVFGWGFWWINWDELKQGWHDKMARTLVVETGGYVEGIHFVKEPLG
ncbi:MAG: hypothetical protein JWP00_816 [Chloroflexi bacterium]|nr:hypothetical protein [Chloroflexota bacterium]